MNMDPPVKFDSCTLTVFHTYLGLTFFKSKVKIKTPLMTIDITSKKYYCNWFNSK